MKIILFSLFLLFSSVTLFAQANDSLLIASLERTTCYGNCPYYKISVYSNGIVVYEGKQHVEPLGAYYTVVSDRKVMMILAMAESIDYWSLQNKYPAQGLGIIDFPTCITHVSLNGKQKTIYNRNDAPTALIRYQNFFDTLFEEIEWEKPTE